jgi:hypothetical protein
MKYCFYFLSVALVSSTVSCQKTTTSPTGPLTATFQLLTEQGQEATVFSQGQNFVFCFRLANTSDQDIYVENPVFDPREFLEVVRLVENQQVSMGKPYTGIFCTYQGGYKIAAHQAMTFTIPWLEAPAYPTSYPLCGHVSTNYLPIGHYRTAFRPSVTWHFWDQGPATSTTVDFQTFGREFEVKK